MYYIHRKNIFSLITYPLGLRLWVIEKGSARRARAFRTQFCRKRAKPEPFEKLVTSLKKAWARHKYLVNKRDLCSKLLHNNKNQDKNYVRAPESGFVRLNSF